MKFDYWSSIKKIQLKENSTENSAEKNLKEDSKFNEIKQKRKEKYTNSKELCFLDTLSDTFPANCTKICNSLSFLSLSFV